MAARSEEGEAADWPAVGEWPSLADAWEHALVILAMNLECRVDDAGGRYAVRADPAHGEAIRRELEQFEAEEAERRAPVEARVFPAGLELAGLWVLSLLAVFYWQLHDPELTSRFGNSSRDVIGSGEWWRPFTALFLHGDVGHLLGNVFIGGMFCLLVAQSIGPWLGWLLILAGGTLGNALNAWVHYPEIFRSIGASTATFAAVGILAGAATVRAWRQHSVREFKPLLVPVMVGLTILAMFGTGGGNTDVGAHITGVGAGVALGMGAGIRR